MGHQAKTGGVEELLPSTSFLAALELLRYNLMVFFNGVILLIPSFRINIMVKKTF